MLSSLVSYNLVDYSTTASFFGYYGADLYKRDALFVVSGFSSGSRLILSKYFCLAFLFSLTDILRISLNIAEIQKDGLTSASIAFLFVLFGMFIIKVLALVLSVQLHTRLRDYRPVKREAFSNAAV
jgi:hypothetical protein